MPSEKGNGHDASCPYRGSGRHLECTDPLTPDPSLTRLGERGDGFGRVGTRIR